MDSQSDGSIWTRRNGGFVHSYHSHYRNGRSDQFLTIPERLI
jgi:hypothetical protein